VKRYYRPLGILSGAAARGAVREGLALPLAGDALAFTLVECIDRHAPGQIERRIVSAVPLADRLARYTAARPPVLGLPVEPPLAMGIVNATPDSFSDGGEHFGAGKAITFALSMIDAGALVVDVGGESTRPGAAVVPVDEEIDRVLPVIFGIRARAAAKGALVSVDTRNAATMQAALKAGARILNDVSALTHDPEAIGVAARSDAAVVLMHMQGEPATMQHAPAYDDVVLDIYD
jgi:dihydropteroate synthase